MSWAWLAPLALAAIAGALFAGLAGAVRRETSRVQLARVEVDKVSRAPGRYGR